MTVGVNGMHCGSCEFIIERALKKVPGVVSVSVNRAKAIATVHYADRVPTQDELNVAVSSHGYSISETAGKAVTRKDYFEVGGAFLVVTALYLILKQFDLLPNIGVSENMSYWIVFLIGLVAALSTCIAVTGGLLLALSNRHAQQHPEATGWERFRPHIRFNLGRLIGYTVLGAAVGGLGSVITISPGAMKVVTIIVSVVMVLLGLQLLRIFPSLTRFQIRMPKFFGHRIVSASEKESGRGPFLLGAATFFLPCGFTQALQLYVLSTGDPWKGALTMGIFALGTLPALLSVGAITSSVKGKWQRYFMRFSGVLVVALGVWNLTSSWGTLTGATAATTKGETIISGQRQIVQMRVDGLDYAPNVFTVRAGVPVEWRVDASGAQGCAQVLVAKQLGVNQLLSRGGITSIAFTPPKPGVYQFSCSMGMAGPGMFVVTN